MLTGFHQLSALNLPLTIALHAFTLHGDILSALSGRACLLNGHACSEGENMICSICVMKSYASYDFICSVYMSFDKVCKQ